MTPPNDIARSCVVMLCNVWDEVSAETKADLRFALEALCNDDDDLPPSAAAVVTA